jgi:cobalt/nickel transport system permease protein
MLPVWAVAARKARKQLDDRQVPLLALGAAFSFVIMLFNIPVPGGTTAHATGAGLAAIILGPWTACVALSAALLIQALLFGDGGILAYGANCFNLAFIMPFAAYFLYHLFRGRGEARGKQSVVAGAIAGYLAINLAALCAAVEFGLQPILFHNNAGVPLYCPYALNQTIPAMALAHLTLGGLAEAVVTGATLAYAGAFAGKLQQAPRPRVAVGKLWFGLAVLTLLSPLGLLAAGTAWGEWTGQELQTLTHYLPAGLERFAGAWRRAPIPDYVPPGFDGGFATLAAGYIISAFIGVGLIALTMRLLQRRLRGVKKTA